MKHRKIFNVASMSIGLLVVLIACNKPPAPSNPSDNIPGVKICNQTWMLKNLDVEKYRNGDPIPQVTDNTQWANLTTGAWCYFQNDAANGVIYGKLYNWYAVNDPRGLAPKGWHIPTANEYSTLANCLGGGPVAGDKLKEAGSVHWGMGNSGATNSSGFIALPGGSRIDYNGSFYIGPGIEGRWWTSTQYDNSWSWFHNLIGSASNSYIDYSDKGDGYYVRCVKD